MGFYEVDHDDVAGLFRRLPMSFWVLVGLLVLINIARGFLHKFIYLAYTVFELLPTLATVEDLTSHSGNAAICQGAAHGLPGDAHTCSLDGARHRLPDKRRGLLNHCAEDFNLADAGCEKEEDRGSALGKSDVPDALLKDRLTHVLHKGKPVTSCPPYTIHTIECLTGDHLRGILWYLALRLACPLAHLGALSLGAPENMATAVAAQVLTPVLLCRLYTYWRHVTILARRVPEPGGDEEVGLSCSAVLSVLLDGADHHVGLWESFRATGLPTFLFAAAGAVTGVVVPGLLADLSVVGIVDGTSSLYPVGAAKALLVWHVLTWTMVVPAQVVLTRVQASLLPTDGRRTIVPFDRTFGVERVRERGYLTATEAWASISWAEWVHIYTALFSAYWLAVVGVLGMVLGFLLQVMGLIGLYAWLGVL